jgi:hypothetical protein
MNIHEHEVYMPTYDHILGNFVKFISNSSLFHIFTINYIYSHSLKQNMFHICFKLQRVFCIFFVEFMP